MDKREKFINFIESLNLTEYGLNEEDVADIQEFWEEFKSGKAVAANGLTENGTKILLYMQANESAQNNLFNCKAIGEGLFMSSRSISGAMRKLITDEYVTKSGNNPVIYSLTTKGREASI